jgi:hypothetical protein
MTGGRISIPPPAGGVGQLTDAENPKTSFRSNWILRLSAMVSGSCRTDPTDWDQTADCSVRSTQLTPVEGVEQLGPELQPHRFANREVLEPGELRNGLMVCSTAFLGIQWREPLIVPGGRVVPLRMMGNGTTIAGSMRCADLLQAAVLHHGLDARVFAAPRCIHLCQFFRVAP